MYQIYFHSFKYYAISLNLKSNVIRLVLLIIYPVVCFLTLIITFPVANRELKNSSNAFCYLCGKFSKNI